MLESLSLKLAEICQCSSDKVLKLIAVDASDWLGDNIGSLVQQLRSEE